MEVCLQNIIKKYDDITVVKDINLTIKSGALHFLLGPSGCGKTTTLRMIAGLEKQSSGKIFFNGENVSNKPSAERGIGMVFQNYALWPHMTVQQNIEYGLKIKKYPSAKIQKRFQESVEITQLGNFTKRFPGQLSGGQQQRVALARALAIRPSVLLLDEPLSNLDAKLRLEMRDNISRIHSETGITTIYVTHDQKEALSMGTNITVMYSGKEIQTGSPKELYTNPKSAFLANFIGETNLIKGHICHVLDNQYKIETSIGTFVANKENNLNFDKDNEVYLSVRPEALKVELPNRAIPKENSNIFEATIKNLTYLGEMEQVTLKCRKTNLPLIASLYNVHEHKLNKSDNIKCFINPEHIKVLPSIDNLGPGT